MRVLTGVLGLAAAMLCGSATDGLAASVTFSFRVVCADGPVPANVRYVAAPNRPSTAVPFVADTRSPSLSYLGPDRLVFFREIGPAGVQGTRVAVASVAVPPNTPQALLVFLPGVDAARLEEFRIILIEEPDVRLARGTIRLLNLSPRLLAGKVATENREIAGWKFEDFRWAARRTDRVPFGLAVFSGEQWEVILDSDFVLAPERRYLLLILPPPMPDSLRFRLKLLEE